MLPSLLAVTAALSLTTAPVAPDSTRYPILNHGRLAGEMLVIRDGSSVVVRYIYTDRNRGQRIESRYRLSPAGDLIGFEMRSIGPDGTPGEPTMQYEVVGDSAKWTMFGPGGRGGNNAGRGPTTTAVKLEPGMFFRTGGIPWENALLVRTLMKQPDRTARMVPQGRARLEFVADTTVSLGRTRQRLRLAMIFGQNTVPSGVWVDERGEFVASDVQWFMAVRPGVESALPVMRRIELAYRDRQAEVFAQRNTKPAQAPVVIRNGDVFDAERGVMMPKTTIVIRGDRIEAVGPADAVAVPAGATVIDATGKSVLPGLWDMHTHFQSTSAAFGSVLQLATGITAIRDLAADTDVGVTIRNQANSLRVISPRTYLAGFIEGPGAWAGPSDVLASSEAQARAFVAMYDSLGYKQIKLYNLLHPDYVPTIVNEAHKRGMRVSGHVPRGMSVAAAVNLGFDEINHAAFLFSNFFQDSLYVPTMRAYSAVAAAVAPNFNVDSPEMTTLIDLLKAKGTVIDGTFNLWMGQGALTGQGNPGAAQYARLLKRLYDAGVPLVAGTDNNTGSTFILELELYQHSGIPAPAVLQIATLNSARIMKDDRDYGSIAVGKVADIIVVNGKPAERISDLRNIEQVVRAGRVYDPRTLRSAVFGSTAQ
ncbi:MAG TPA: amidohydrolase family protein [Gemmatimonadaceae bacterium]